MSRESHREGPSRHVTPILLAAAATVPAFLVRFLSLEPPYAVQAVIFGLAILGAAFLLSWAAETAQVDISAGLAIAVLAFIAVLPEYAIDLVFARKGGNAVQAFGEACRAPGASGETSCSLALANMTGANRLLIGIGWAMVVFIAAFRSARNGTPKREIRLAPTRSTELAFLVLATAYSLTLPFKATITLFDAAVLVAIFAAYTLRLARQPSEEPELIGPPAYLGALSRRRRRAAVAGLFVFAATVILLSAERFADALVHTGADLGVSEFLLVQWLAPLASEAPELLVAGLYAWRLNTDAGLGTLVSSKVNQWTLLVGTLPIVFALASGGFHGLPIEARQREELLLTAAQSLFAVAILSNLSMSLREASLVFGLFWAQFIIGGIVPESMHGMERIVVAAMYLILGAGILLRDRQRLPRLIREGLRGSSRRTTRRGSRPG